MYNVISAQRLIRGNQVSWQFPVMAYQPPGDNQDKESISSEASSVTPTSTKAPYDYDEHSISWSSKQKKTKDKPKKVDNEPDSF